MLKSFLFLFIYILFIPFSFCAELMFSETFMKFSIDDYNGLQTDLDKVLSIEETSLFLFSTESNLVMQFGGESAPAYYNVESSYSDFSRVYELYPFDKLPHLKVEIFYLGKRDNSKDSLVEIHIVNRLEGTVLITACPVIHVVYGDKSPVEWFTSSNGVFIPDASNEKHTQNLPSGHGIILYSLSYCYVYYNTNFYEFNLDNITLDSDNRFKAISDDMKMILSFNIDWKNISYIVNDTSVLVLGDLSKHTFKDNIVYSTFLFSLPQYLMNYKN